MKNNNFFLCRGSGVIALINIAVLVVASEFTDENEWMIEKDRERERNR